MDCDFLRTLVSRETAKVQCRAVQFPNFAPEEADIAREAGQGTLIREPHQYRDSQMNRQILGAPCTTVEPSGACS